MTGLVEKRRPGRPEIGHHEVEIGRSQCCLENLVLLEVTVFSQSDPSLQLISSRLKTKW